MITAKMLEAKGADCKQVAQFRKLWPDGAAVTLANFQRAQEARFPLVWLVWYFCTSATREAYYKADAVAMETFRKAEERLWGTYWKAESQATEAAKSQATKARQKAESQAIAAYKKANAPALWEAIKTLAVEQVMQQHCTIAAQKKRQGPD